MLIVCGSFIINVLCEAKPVNFDAKQFYVIRHLITHYMSQKTNNKLQSSNS
jgi:hypothetical protein